MNRFRWLGSASGLVMLLFVSRANAASSISVTEECPHARPQNFVCALETIPFSAYVGHLGVKDILEGGAPCGPIYSVHMAFTEFGPGSVKILGGGSNLIAEPGSPQNASFIAVKNLHQEVCAYTIVYTKEIPADIAYLVSNANLYLLYALQGNGDEPATLGYGPQGTFVHELIVDGLLVSSDIAAQAGALLNGSEGVATTTGFFTIAAPQLGEAVSTIESRTNFTITPDDVGMISMSLAFGGAKVPTCDGDTNLDGKVTAEDTAVLLGSWGELPLGRISQVDFDKNENIDSNDLGAQMGSWGLCE